MKKVAFCYGTRPEIIKLSPVIREANSRFEVCTIFSGQHTSLYEDVRDLVPNPTYIIPSVKSDRNLTEFVCSFGMVFDQVIRKISPDLLVIQGDTATAYMAALTAFHAGIKVGHVEAGLRTYNVLSPFPEEFYRRNISNLASINFCPTPLEMRNLNEELVHGITVLTGNPIVDAVNGLELTPTVTNKVVVTLHRRENANRFEGLIGEINDIAITSCRELEFIFPAHPTPAVQRVLDKITAPNFKVVPPMGYKEFMELLASCMFIISDSGGIQEEACCLRKKVIVCRDTTERPQACWVDHAVLLKNQSLYSQLQWVYRPAAHNMNPFGDGKSAQNIVNAIEEYLV